MRLDSIMDKQLIFHYLLRLTRHLNHIRGFEIIYLWAWAGRKRSHWPSEAKAATW